MTTFKKIILMAVIVISLSTACGTIPQNIQITFPTTSPSIPAAPNTTVPVSSGMGVSYMGTSFTIPSGLASGTQNEIVSQANGMGIWPAYSEMVLQGYPLQGTTFKPQILVLPAGEYAQMDQDVAKLRIERLQNILNTQNFSVQPIPDIFIINRSQEELPFLPNEHAGQVFHVQEKFQSFQNGSGIRYVTQLSQAAFPLINNQDIVYTFQGLTSDGKYYVSVIMPINLPYLAADYGPDAYINPTKEQNPDAYPGYVSDMTVRLNQAEGEGTNPYAPSLASLDALVQSLLVAPETSAVMPSPATGNSNVLWKTYRNDVYGFTFEYPAIYDDAAYKDSCDIKESGEGIHLGHQIYLLVLNSGGLGLADFTNTLLQSKG